MEKIKRINFEIIKKYLLIIVGLFIIAISFNLFFLPYDLVVYDSNGLAVIINNFIDVKPSTIIFAFSVLCLIFGFIFLGFKDTKNAIIASVIYPFFVEITKNVSDYVAVNEVDMLVVALFAGVTTGIGNGLVFRSNFNTGGTDLLELIFCKYIKVPFGWAVLLIDGSIVVAGGLIFGYELMIYAIITLVLISVISDKIILGIKEQKAFYIISKKKELIKKYLIEGLNKSVTELEGKGFHTGYDEDVLLCVVKTREYYKIKKGIEQIDPKAFLIINDTHEVIGSDNI